MALNGTWYSLLSNRSGELRIIGLDSPETTVEFLHDDIVVYTERVTRYQENNVSTFVSIQPSKHVFVCRIHLDLLSGKYCGNFTTILPLDQGTITF